MPTYKYRCDHCGHALELFQKMSDNPAVSCPACENDTLVRVITGGVGVIFKGGGFYVNDSKQHTTNSSTQKVDTDSATNNETAKPKSTEGGENNAATTSNSNNDTPTKPSPSNDNQNTTPTHTNTNAR